MKDAELGTAKVSSDELREKFGSNSSSTVELAAYKVDRILKSHIMDGFGAIMDIVGNRASLIDSNLES